MNYSQGLQEVADGVYAIVLELSGDEEPLNPLVALEQMARLAHSDPQSSASASPSAVPEP